MLKAKKACKLETEHSTILKSRTKTSTLHVDLAVRNFGLWHVHKNNGRRDTKDLFQGEADVIKERISSMLGRR